MAPVVQWIEWKIPVLQIRVRFPTGVHVMIKGQYIIAILFFFLYEYIKIASRALYDSLILNLLLIKIKKIALAT